MEIPEETKLKLIMKTKPFVLNTWQRGVTFLNGNKKARLA